MKKILTCLAVISLTLSCLAQPQKMSYQCVIRNSSGVLVTNHNVGIRLSILQGTETGTAVYQETYNPNPQTNTNGLLSIEIGGGLAITGTFSAIDWASGPYYLKTETDPAGGTNYTIVGTSQLLSVPYAMYAKTSENAFSGNYNDLTNKPTLFNGAWANITDKPTSLTGYGISDGMNTSHVANGITSNLIGNWNTAFSWGNHTGLYKPISYVPSWTEITNKPTTLTGYGITDAVNTTGDQSIGGNKTFTGTINTNSHNITNVANPVNAQDAATKAYVDAMEGQIIMLKNTLKAGGIVTDIDGNAYNTVVIGTQTWMAENLKTTKYNDGTAIPQVTDAMAWSGLSTAAYCDWFNHPITSATYGRLYNWYVVAPTNPKNVCPTDWHVSTDDEWTILTNYLGGEGVVADKIKETGTSHWAPPNSTATNESGFTALPGGCRDHGGGLFFDQVSIFGYWWSSSESSPLQAWSRSMVSENSNFYRSDLDKGRGQSVRCLKN
jgi:uncharacterized protein (TIGR02145 family)